MGKKIGTPLDNMSILFRVLCPFWITTGPTQSQSGNRNRPLIGFWGLREISWKDLCTRLVYQRRRVQTMLASRMQTTAKPATAATSSQGIWLTVICAGARPPYRACRMADTP